MSKLSALNRPALNRRSWLAGMSSLVVAGCTRMEHPAIAPAYLNGYNGLAELPYFQLVDGALRLHPDLEESLPLGTDFHSHLGLSLFLSSEIDYHQHSETTDYLVNCFSDDKRCAYNLNDYLNKIASPELLREMDKKLVTQGLPGGSDAARTHTIPNLVAEMDVMHVQRAVLLAVAPRLPVRYNPTEDWLKAIAESEHKDRFVIFGGVNVRDSGAVGQVREFAKQGVKGIKIHPTMQHVSPDEKAAMDVYEVCDELGLTVFFHAGRAGIEPAYGRSFARIHNYIAPAREFPDVQFVFGHAGARDWREALAVASQHENVWLEVEGQGVYELRTILKSIGSERLLFGSDWPFYPLAATLGRVLMATDGDIKARDRIFAHNANALLGVPA